MTRKSYRGQGANGLPDLAEGLDVVILKEACLSGGEGGKRVLVGWVVVPLLNPGRLGRLR